MQSKTLNFIIFFSKKCIFFLKTVVIISLVFNYSTKSQIKSILNEFYTLKYFALPLNLNLTLDTLNQLKVNDVTRTVANNLIYDGVNFVSKFDGNYAMQFYGWLFLSDSSNSPTTRQSKTKQYIESTISLFSGTKNGFTQTYASGQYNSFFWSFNPHFEINNGTYYPDKDPNPLNQKLLTNSSHQNISNKFEFGFKNEQSSISSHTYFSFGNLFVPNSLLDTQKIINKFDKYNTIFTQIKFNNSFGNNLQIEGNIYLKNLQKDFSSTRDSSFLGTDVYDKEYQFEEFNYGINSRFTLQTQYFDAPSYIYFSYGQDLFLINNRILAGRNRVEAENLQIRAEQSLSIAPLYEFTIFAELKLENILYSSLGKLPNKHYAYNIELDNKILLNSNLKLINSIYKKSYFPYIQHYFTINNDVKGNIDLIPESWYYVSSKLSYDISNKINLSPQIKFFWGNNLINITKSPRQYSNDGYLRGLQLDLDGNLSHNNFIIIYKINYTYYDVNHYELICNNFLKINKLNLNLNFAYFWQDDFNIELNFKFHDGYHSINPLDHQVVKLNSYYLINLLLQKQYDIASFVLILRNITNNYYEHNIGIPNRGLNLLIGTTLRF